MADEVSGIEAVRRFMNSVDVETATDELADPVAASRWLLEQRLTDQRLRLSADDLGRVVGLRTGLRAMAAEHAGHEPDPHALADLQAVARTSPLVFAPSPEGGTLALVPAGRGVDAVIAGLLAEVQAASASRQWERIKLCREDTCQWVYHDRSRNRSGQWCDMAVCGNRNKVKSFRDRQRGERS